MNDRIVDLKSALRTEVQRELSVISREERTGASQHASELLMNQAPWKKARSVLFYFPLPDELDLSALWERALADGKILALPRYREDRQSYDAARLERLAAPLPRGRFGIPEPGADCPSFPLNQLDLALVPGVAFDLGGRRLGRGRGFYDRLLREVRGLKCGVAFDRQIRAGIPFEPHDVVVNCILTPTRWLSVG